MRNTLSRKVVTGAAAALTLGAMTIIAPQAASAAAARNGVCETGEFCYYYNSNEAGSVSDFTTSVASYGTTQPDCYDFKTPGLAGYGICVKNNAASVWNNSSVPVTVYYNSNYGGTSQTIPAGARANLITALKNNNASHQFGAGTTPPPPPPTTGGSSSIGGQISRDETRARAQNWINRAIPYSQTSYATDLGGVTTYRQDCSGFVSMAWHLGSSRNTDTLRQVSTQLSGYGALQPGDMLDKATGAWSSQHVVLFIGWQDATHAIIAEEQKPGTVAHTTTYSLSYLQSNGYLPYRYNNITG